MKGGVFGGAGGLKAGGDVAVDDDLGGATFSEAVAHIEELQAACGAGALDERINAAKEAGAVHRVAAEGAVEGGGVAGLGACADGRLADRLGVSGGGEGVNHLEVKEAHFVGGAFAPGHVAGFGLDAVDDGLVCGGVVIFAGELDGFAG